MDTKGLLILIIVTVVISIATVVAVERQRIEPQELKFELRRELPNGRCIYALSTPPHNKNNGYINTDCLYENKAYKITE